MHANRISQSNQEKTKMKKFGISVVAALSGVVIATSAFAQGFHGHGHRGSAALTACLVAAPQSVKQSLWTTFKNSPIREDKQAVHTAKANLNEQILAKNTNLGSYETALSQAQLKLLQDQDAIATSVCGQLSSAQLTAANMLYTNLQNNRQAVRGYFEAAHQAADSSSGGE
jgi:hypothetical protein